MDKIILSQSGVYRLQQLASQVYHHTRVRYKLSDQAGMVNMLSDASRSNHKVIRAYFAAFSQELSAEQRVELMDRGVILAPPLNGQVNTGGFRQAIA